MPKQADWRGRFSPDPRLRIGDAERNAAADALSQHYSAGRLDDTELKERLDLAMNAKTGADLAGLTSDLPPLGPATPQPPVPNRPGRRRSGLWIALCVIFLLTAFAHGPVWWPWWMAVRIPWLIVAGVAFILWRRSRNRRWRTGSP
jgi:Domain of unknown function (DUF1707)